MSFPTTTVTSGTHAQAILANAANTAGLAEPTGGLSQIDMLAWAVAELLANQPAVLTAQSVTAASPSAGTFPNDNTVTVNRAGGTVSAGANSFYPVRGTATLTATTTFKEGYLFGVKAAATIAGVVDQTSATRVGALFAKIDVSAATLTAGQISAAWFDWGSTATTPASAECNVIRVQNTTAAVINSLIYAYGKATYLADVSDNGAGWFGATAPTSLAKSLKVNVNGTTYYIGLYSAAS